MSPFAIKMLAVLGLLCVLVQDTTAGREYVWGGPQINETVFVGARQVIGHPIRKRRVEIKYPDEFFVGQELPGVIHGIEVFEMPDGEACRLYTDIIGGIGKSFANVSLKSSRNCGLYVRVTFRVHREPSNDLTKIPDDVNTYNTFDEDIDDE